MHPHLKSLIELQAVDIRLIGIRERLARFPKSLMEVEARVTAARQQVTAAKEALLTGQKERKTYEMDVEVGFVPENVNTVHLHTVGTAMAIGFGQLAILILGLVLREIPDWLREFMIVTSLFVLLAGISIAGKHQFGIGAGALERLAQYPESVWLILFGFYISRDHYRNKVAPSGFKFSEKNLYTREMFDERRKKGGEGAR